MLFIVDTIDSTRTMDTKSQEYLERMNTRYNDLVKAAKEVEETFEQVDLYMLNDATQKKVDCFLSKCSNVVACDKMLMKTAHSVFSTVHVHENSQNQQQKNHLCETCSNFFDSMYKLKEHKCTKKWICTTCRQNMHGEHNLRLHNQKPCVEHTCKKCFMSFYNRKEFQAHKNDCQVVVCKICHLECNDLEGRRKHMRKEHSSS